MNNSDWWQRNRVEFFISLFGLISIHAFLFFGAFSGNDINASNASQYGDFVGGYIGTIFALISVVFLYATLKDQRKTSENDKFEVHYFELIKLHRDNVQEIGIKGEFGKKVFVLLIREFREILKITKSVFRDEDNVVVIQISYLILFYGIGPNSTRILKKSLKNFSPEKVSELCNMLDAKKDEVQEKRKFNYVPFEGHQSRLGHYYRHLFQSIMFCHNKQLDIDKYRYVKLFRAQLSNHEQALLLLNSISVLGAPWRENGLITEYKLIKNIPEDFFDSEKELNMKKLFPEIKFEFEEL